MREIVFDTETTGLSPTDDRIFEIGMVELDGRLPTGRTFYYLLDPEMPLSAASVRITGFTDDDVRGKPTFSSIVDELLDFIGDTPLVAHNATFDMGFLQAELTRNGKARLQNEVIDTLAIAREKIPGARHTLDALCNRFNVDASDRTVHGALLDANLLVDVYIELMGGLQGNILDSLDAEATAKQQQKRQAVSGRSVMSRPPSTDELTAHQAFIEKHLKESLWG